MRYITGRVDWTVDGLDVEPIEPRTGRRLRAQQYHLMVTHEHLCETKRDFVFAANDDLHDILERGNIGGE